MMKRFFAVLSILFLATVFPASQAFAKFSTAPRTVTVVAVTDLHGALEPTTALTKSGEPVVSGGAAYLSTYIQRIRASAPGPVVLVDAGDLFQGTIVSNMAEGAPVIQFYNYLNVAATTLGNHDFDYGPAGPKTVPVDFGDDPRGALKARLSEAKFPMLAANVIYNDRAGQVAGRIPEWLRPSIVYTVPGNIRVGIIGAADPNTRRTTKVANVLDLDFLDPLPAIVARAKALRESGVDVIVLAIHMGGGCADNRAQALEDLRSCTPTPFMALLGQLPPGLIDVVVGGHTHQAITKRIGRTAVLEPLSSGRSVTWATIDLDRKTTDISPAVFGPVAICGTVVAGPSGPTCDPQIARQTSGGAAPALFLGAPVVPDRNVLSLLAGAFESARRIRQRPIGIRALSPFDRRYDSRESAVANFTVDSLRRAMPPDTITVNNVHGIRAGIPAGDLTYGDVYEVLPFDNQAAVVRVNGKQLIRIVELGHRGTGLVWSGLTFGASKCDLTSVEVNDKPVDPDTEYTLVTSDFLATGDSVLFDAGVRPDQVRVLEGPQNTLLGLTLRGMIAAGPVADPVSYFDPNNPRQRLAGQCNPATLQRIR